MNRIYGLQIVCLKTFRGAWSDHLIDARDSATLSWCCAPANRGGNTAEWQHIVEHSPTADTASLHRDTSGFLLSQAPPAAYNLLLTVCTRWHLCPFAEIIFMKQMTLGSVDDGRQRLSIYVSRANEVTVILPRAHMCACICVCGLVFRVNQHLWPLFGIFLAFCCWKTIYVRPWWIAFSMSCCSYKKIHFRRVT